jgi:replication fork protection complex subunit Csm3/Swi3
MATIDNLWDEPVESESVHLATRPVTSSEDPLFLRSDSEDEGGTSAAGPRQSKAPEDIGALFDVDDDDKGQLSNVTYEQLQRDALSGGNMLDDGPSSRENQEANEGPSEGVSNANSMFDKKNEDGKAAGTRRTIPKLDEDLLLSEKGIPALIKDAKRWRPKGKGHEVSCFFRMHQMDLYGFGRTSDFGPQPSHSDVSILGSPNVPPAYFQ